MEPYKNGIWQNRPPKIDKCDTHKKIAPHKNGTPYKKMPKCHMQGLSWVIFKGNSKVCSMIQTHGYGTLKSSFSSLWLIVGLGFISMVLVVLEKSNMSFLWDVVFMRCYLCWLPFLWGDISDKSSDLFVVLCQWVSRLF